MSYSKAISPAANSVPAKYLLFFNTLSLGMWLFLMISTVKAFFQPDYGTKYAQLPKHYVLGHSARVVQSLAIFEVAHSLIGLVRAGFFTTFIQVLSRLYVVWLVLPYLGDTTLANYGFAGLLAAWCPAEIMKYGYHIACSLSVKPKAFTWLRYSGFIILYPLGVLSEATLVSQSFLNVQNKNPALASLFAVSLILYLPGLVYLYSYMLKQRKRALYPNTTSLGSQHKQAKKVE